MGPNSWYLLQYLVIPLSVANIAYASRTSICHAIRRLSIVALAIAGVKWILFFIIYNHYAGFFEPLGFPGTADTLFSNLYLIYNLLLNLAIFLGVAAWAIAMWDAAHTKRRQWFTIGGPEGPCVYAWG